MFPSLQLCETGKFEFDGDLFLFFGDHPNSTVLKEPDISTDPSSGLRDPESKCIQYEQHYMQCFIRFLFCRFFFNIQQLFLVTVHVNECINIMLCFKTTVSYTYVDFDNWKETLQTKHWGYLLKNLVVKLIVEELYQGVEEVPLITHQVYDEIRNAKSNREANTIFMKHLKTAGTVKQFKSFCKVLHQTTGKCRVHEEILKRLKKDFNFNF